MEDTKYTGNLWGNDSEVQATQPTIETSSEQNVQSDETNYMADQSDTTQPSKPTPQESFSEIRAKADKLQRERDDALLTLQRIEQYALQQQNKVPEPAPVHYDDDDYIEGKHFKQEINSLKQQLDSFKNQQQSSSMEMQLRSKYNDFDRVMTYENISKLRELRPEIAASLNKAKDIDPYNTCATVYTLLKEFGIYRENTHSPERDRVEHNSNKPRVAASLQKTESALSHASEFSGSRLTETRKKEIYSQMMKNSR